jgi:hypothetical protein
MSIFRYFYPEDESSIFLQNISTILYDSEDHSMNLTVMKVLNFLDNM